MNIEVVDKLDEDKWEQFVLSCPSGNIFHTPRMMEVFRRTNGYEPMLLAAMGSEENLLSLILPVRINTITRFLGKFNSRAVLYGGVLFYNNQGTNSSLGHLMESYSNFMSKQNLFTEIRNSVDTSIIRKDLIDNGFCYEEYLNYLIELDASEEQIFKKISRTHIQCIRKSKNLGVLVEEIKRRDLSSFYRIIQKTYSRIKIPGPDISLFEAAFDILYPMGMAKFLMAFKDGIPIGAIALLFYKSSAYAWYLGSDEAYFNAYPNHILIWESIKLAKDNGYKIFDFLGAGRPNEKYGVRTFKSRFGGKLTNYGRYYKIDSSLAFNISKKIYGIYRKFL